MEKRKKSFIESFNEFKDEKIFHRRDYRGAKIDFNKHYAKRAFNDRTKGLHHKVLKYPKWINDELKELSKESGVSVNDMFIFSVYACFLENSN